MTLPESLHFLRPGWWVLHMVTVGGVFAAGFFVSYHLAGHDADAAHAGHHTDGHHDHTSPEVLRPLMQQMLVDAVQLQGALADGDLPRAAKHADAIGGACEDSGSQHSALPQRLGPSFLEHDRALHGVASRLAEALRAGRRDDARALNRELVTVCQSCHGQAPAAQGVDLQVLTSFTDTLASAAGEAR